MKITIILSFLLGSLIFSTSAYSQGESSSVSNTKEIKQSTEKPKKRRRKKVLMCEECGKPETECDCEGHGDNEENHEEDKS